MKKILVITGTQTNLAVAEVTSNIQHDELDAKVEVFTSESNQEPVDTYNLRNAIDALKKAVTTLHVNYRPRAITDVQAYADFAPVRAGFETLEHLVQGLGKQ